VLRSLSDGIGRARTHPGRAEEKRKTEEKWKKSLFLDADSLVLGAALGSPARPRRAPFLLRPAPVSFFFFLSSQDGQREVDRPPSSPITACPLPQFP
jgi:hypothetical protein